MNKLIDRARIKEKLEKEFRGFIPEQYDLEKLDYKIAAAKTVIEDLNTSISHAYGVHKALLKWNQENVEDIQARAEILREILMEKYQKYN